MKRTLALLVALTLAVGLLAACGGGGGGGGFEMKVNLASEPQTIDPALNSSVDGAVMAHHFFEGLYKWADSGTDAPDGTGMAELVLGQAESVVETTNADGTITYTFTLRDDIKWSDGQPVVAGDFEYGLKRLVDPATAADYAYILDGIIVGATEIMSPDDPAAEELTFDNAPSPDTLAVTAVDDKTLEITITGPCPYFVELLAFPPLFPVRKDIIEANGDQWTFDPATYIGNGPYKMTEWEHNSYILSEKNDQHYDYANLGPDRIRYVLMDDAQAMLTGFESGELDFIENMPVDEIPALLDSGKLHVVDYIGTYYVSFQVQKAPFDDARVREAFTLAINRQHIVENITRTGQVPAAGFVPAGIYDAAGATGDDFRTTGGDWYDASAGAYEANCERARQLMADAGYPNGEGFPVVEYLYNTDDNHRAIGEALQADWQNVLGVTVTLANQDWGVFLETRKNGEYQIARNGWIADFNDPISFIDMWVTGSGNNDAQYSNPAFDALVAKSREPSTAEERMATLHEAEALMRDDFMLGPIYYYTNKYMLTDGIDGMFYTPLGYFLFSYCTKG